MHSTRVLFRLHEKALKEGRLQAMWHGVVWSGVYRLLRVIDNFFYVKVYVNRVSTALVAVNFD